MSGDHGHSHGSISAGARHARPLAMAFGVLALFMVAELVTGLVTGSLALLSDPVVGVGIGVFILPRTWRLAARAVRVLVQAAPPGLDLDALGSS